MKFKNTLIALILGFFSFNGLTARELPVNRHYIIVVDQTIKSSNTNMGTIYHNLCHWLKGEPISGLNMEASTIPESQKFDEKNDAISLFAFGLPGDGRHMNSVYGQIHKECYNHIKSANEVLIHISSSLIHKRNRLIDGNCVFSTDNSHVKESLETFLSTNLHGLFNSTDELHISISKNSGITMSHFVYPLIMNFISKKEPANEYYLILVSDFKSGLYSNNDEDDWNTFSYLTAGDSHIRARFEQQINTMRAPFVQADFLHFQSGDIAAKGTRLMHKGVVLKSQLYLNGSLSLSQADGNLFNLSKAQISFDKDNLSTIDSIGVVVMENNQVLCSKIIARGDEVKSIAGDNRTYNIPKQTNLDLHKSSLENIKVKYIFYTMSHDQKGNDILPTSLVAQQTIDKDSITYINEELREYMTILGTVLFVIAFIALLCWRGRRKNVICSISRFAQKYVAVTKEKGAVELPCWFHINGQDAAKLRVSGKVTKANGVSLGCSKKLYVRLQETMPEGFSYWINGTNAKDFRSIEINNRGEFFFDLDISVDTSLVNTNKLSTCSVMIDFKVETALLGKIIHTDEGIGKMVYDYYFIEDLGRAWIGFDPGTSGSCMAVGNPNGALNNPNISMVTVKNGGNTTDIIPSKLIFDKNLKGKTAMSLIPGTDYQYGIEAERNWIAARNMPRFQSIKKLLGYKKSEDDKIEIPTSGDPLRLSGVDMAHLLVKGLFSDLNYYLHKLSASEKQRILGDSNIPQRAVVAIPNNYTLPKIQDMVESIKRIGVFKEVRYIYEAEGILFNYLRKTFKEKHPSEENIMVYDMGGATINLTVFRIKYVSRNNSTYYEISTLGRIGYAVGGDNIDVALMEHIFAMKTSDENKRHTYQKQHKTEILNAMLRLKKNLIYASRTQKNKNTRTVSELDVIYDKGSFEKFANKVLGELGNIQQFNDEDTDFPDNIFNEFIESEEMEKFVCSRVNDAVEEIMKYPEVASLKKIDKLIFAGRSTMFPKIQETAIYALTEKTSTKNIKILENLLDDFEIKTSVAYGACWYGIYNGLVTLDNSRLSSAYGFKQTTGNDSKLNIMLNQNSVFGDDNTVKASENVVSNFDGDGQTIAFYQVMGSGVGDDLLAEKNRYKVNYLTSIPVSTTTNSISIEVGRNNTATCSVKFDTGITVSKSDVDIETRDIAEENDWAYIFATTEEEKVSASSYGWTTSSLKSSTSSNTYKTKYTSNKRGVNRF